MQEKLENGVDKGKWFEAFLTDLSKAFDCLSQELLIAKLRPYGFDLPALKRIQNYLSNGKQRTKINQRIAHGTRLYLEYHKDLFPFLYYLIFFCAMYFG